MTQAKRPPRSRWSLEEDKRLLELEPITALPKLSKILGRSRTSILSRLDYIQLHGMNRKQIPCMCCGKTFESEGPMNRLCYDCKFSHSRDSVRLSGIEIMEAM